MLVHYIITLTSFGLAICEFEIDKTLTKVKNDIDSSSLRELMAQFVRALLPDLCRVKRYRFEIRSAFYLELCQFATLYCQLVLRIGLKPTEVGRMRLKKLLHLVFYSYTLYVLTSIMTGV